jgi:hypothetical protein
MSLCRWKVLSAPITCCGAETAFAATRTESTDKGPHFDPLAATSFAVAKTCNGPVTSSNPWIGCSSTRRRTCREDLQRSGDIEQLHRGKGQYLRSFATHLAGNEAYWACPPEPLRLPMPRQRHFEAFPMIPPDTHLRIGSLHRATT